VRLGVASVYNSLVTEPDDGDIVIISAPISAQRLSEIADHRFGDMVKAVVDTERRVVALGSELHSDEELALIEQGSKQVNLWGVNIYPDKPRSEWVEFDSLINIRPRLGNRSRSVEDAATRILIREIVDSLVK
jgi:hypothetical protein